MADKESATSWFYRILRNSLISLEPRTGMNVRDTITCSLDSLGFAVGQKTKIRVQEYGKVYFATTDFIEIIP